MLKTPNCHQGKIDSIHHISIKVHGKIIQDMPSLQNQVTLHTSRQCDVRGVVHNHGYTCALLLETRKLPQPASARRVLSPLLSSFSVCIISVEAFLLLFIDLECIKNNMAQGKRIKGMETQVASSEGERLKEEQMDLADQHLVLQLRLVTGIWLL